MGSGGNDVTVSMSSPNSLTVSGAVVSNIGTGNGDDRTLAVGSGSFSCASLTMENPDNTVDSDCLLSISTGTATVTGNLTFNGFSTENFVTFTGSGILNVGGNFGNGAGFTSSTGTVHYNNDGAQNVGAYTYYNVTLSGSGTKTCNSGDMTVNEKLSLQGTATFVISGAGNTLSYSTGTLEYKGSSAQTTTDEEFVTSSGPSNLIIDNSAGITLHASRTVSSTLTMTSGNIALNSNTLTLGSGETDGTRGTLSWADGFMMGAGTFKRFFSGSAVAIGNAQGLFPMGGSNHSLWIGGTPSQTGSVLVQHSNATGFTATSDISDDGVTVNRRHNMSWTITVGDGFQDTDAQLRIQGSGIPGIAVEPNLRIILSNGFVTGTLNVADGSGTVSDPIVERNGFSNTELANTFYIGADGTENPLPVELSSFAASVKNYTVHLNWETATEKSNYGFDVERSADKISWSKVAFVNGHGNSNSPKQYSYTDSKISSGKYYYRLKQMDTEGSFTYSKEIEVSTGVLLNDFVVEQNFPNPFNPTTTIKFGFKEPVSAKVIIYNALGSEVTTLFNERTEEGRIYSIDFDGSQLASGIYYYSVSGGNYNSVKKMILMK